MAARSPARLPFNLVTLRLFIAVYEERSLARAAEREFIAPSALSRRIAELEEQLGQALFVRSPRGIAPTPLAEQLLPHVRNVMRDLMQIGEIMHASPGGICGYVRLMTTMAASCQYLPGELACFLQRYPGVRVDLQEAVSAQVTEAVRRGETDLGILFAGPPCADLHSLPYHRDTLVALVPSAHHLAARPALSFAQLLDEGLIGPRQGSTLAALLTQAAAALGRELRPRMRVAAFDTACQLVHEALGVAIVPRHYVQRINRELKLTPVRLDETWAKRQLSLCVKDLTQLPPAARLLLDFLQARVSDQDLGPT